MKNYQSMLQQEQPDPDVLATEVAGIGAGLTILQILIDGNDETQVNERLILDYIYSASEHLRRISDDLSECGRIKRELVSQLDVTRKALNDAMNKTEQDESRDFDKLQVQGEAILHETGADLSYDELQSLYNAAQSQDTVKTIAKAYQIGVAVGSRCK